MSAASIATDSPPPATRVGRSGDTRIPACLSTSTMSTSPNVWMGNPASRARLLSLLASPLVRSWRIATTPTPNCAADSNAAFGSTASEASVAIKPSSPRIASGSTSGIASRTTHGTDNSGCNGSSRVHPQDCRANCAPGTINVRVSAALLFNQSAASCQYPGTCPYAPLGARRPDQAGATEHTSTNTTSTPAVCRRPERAVSAHVWGRRTTLPQVASPTSSGIRTTGSNL